MSVRKLSPNKEMSSTYLPEGSGVEDLIPYIGKVVTICQSNGDVAVSGILTSVSFVEGEVPVVYFYNHYATLPNDTTLTYEVRD